MFLNSVAFVAFVFLFFISPVFSNFNFLVPQPKVLQRTGDSFILDANTVMVIEPNACQTLRYAAEQLKLNIKKRFGVEILIKESDKDSNGRSCIMLQTDCRHNGCKMTSLDAFSIRTGPGSAVITGASPRAVVYGQFTLFDLITDNEGKLTIPGVLIRDWPSIKWRGQPTISLDEHLETGVFDTYMRARLNWIDLRDGSGSKKGAFGFVPGDKLDTIKINKVVNEAHRRGLAVFASVMCGVDEKRHSDVLKTFEELIKLGADGLWLVFDDPGPGEDAEAMVVKVFALGKRYGIGPDKMMITPPSGCYQSINAQWNRRIAKINGAGQMAWIFTSAPSPSQAQLAKEIGLGRLPGWGHNWPRTDGGLLHAASGAQSLYDSPHAYFQVLGIEWGWESPQYQDLKNASEHVDMVYIWSTAVPAEYGATMLGWWAWDPCTHEWPTTKRAIYSQVFGRASVQAAEGFDSKLVELTNLFTQPRYKEMQPWLWPPKLKNVENRGQALNILAQMQQDMDLLVSNSQQSLLDPNRVNGRFLKLMQDTIKYGRIMANLDYPEYKYSDLPVELASLVKQGKIPDAQAKIDLCRDGVISKLTEINKQLAPIHGIDKYISAWTDYVAGTDHWIKAVNEEDRSMAAAQESKKRCSENFSKLAPKITDLMVQAGNVPQGKVLAQVSPKALLEADWQAQGDYWGIGLGESNSVVVACGPGQFSKKGDVAEVVFKLKVPQYSGPRAPKLQAYVNYYAPADAPKGVRHMYLSLNKKTIWMQDMAFEMQSKWLTLETRNCCFPGEVHKVKFQVANEKDASDYASVAVIGPVRLVLD